MKTINCTAEGYFHSYTTVYSYMYLYYTHIYFTDVVKIVHEDYTMFSDTKRLSGASLWLLAACLPSILLGIPIERLRR